MNSSDGPSEHSEFAEFGRGFIFSVLTIAAVVGNSLSILALFVTKKWHTRYLIVSLAITDLSLGALVMPFATISAVKQRWIFNHVWCDAQASLGFLLCQVSVATITCISLERYVLFTYPSVHFRWVQTTSKGMQWLIIATWIYGGLWTFSAWQIPHFAYQRELLNCAVRWKHDYYFTLICGFITSCIPIAVILFCNFKVTLKVSKMMKKISINRDRSESDTMKRNITQVKISRMLLAVTAAFLVCWAPYSIGGVCYLLPECTWPEDYYIASVFFCLFNSAINPILYGTFDRRFRRALRYVLWKVLKLVRTSTMALSGLTAINMRPVAASASANGNEIPLQ
ncbi:alpha-2C adrenergic receptor-like [Dendronephthya gigantea]|uniref:alpha-2C adrenergic receptor-like n=1 Tax=Dendronephthya gigantea TaxID=151771 RepID=UPI00106C72C0|nr:alpha-2C adrenergic receptor-like [Dendronephthya gigantea]